MAGSTRRLNSFTKELQNEFPMYKATNDSKTVWCEVCNASINLGNQGKPALQKHLETEKYKKNVRSSSSIRPINTHFTVQNSTLERKVLAAEGTFAFHTAVHCQSYKSADCSSKLFKAVFPDSMIADKFSSGRTKTEAIVNNVIAPHSLELLKTEISKNNVMHIGASSDGSNHLSTKLFPIVIQYYIRG